MAIVQRNEVILDLCGGTGAWSKPYVDNGYTVRILTKPSTDIRLLEKIQDVVIHGILAAPPCTHLAGSGARWWSAKGEPALLEALSIVDACIRIVAVHKPKWWCLENPVGRLSRYLGKPREYFDPCDYGDPYTKKTCLWGKFTMPPKSRVDPMLGSVMHLLPPSENRAALRSITSSRFALAFFKVNP